MKLKTWASVMALVLVPHVASGDIDSTVLMKHKDWEVTHDYLTSIRYRNRNHACKWTDLPEKVRQCVMQDLAEEADT
jgi:hypothetical protein